MSSSLSGSAAATAAHTLDTPPDSSQATASGSPVNLLTSTARKPPRHSANKTDSNASLFSDSIGDFTSDFTLSDAEQDDKTASQKLSQLTDQLRTEIALGSQGKSGDNVAAHKSVSDKSQASQAKRTYNIQAKTDKPLVKPEPKTPVPKSAVKREPGGVNVKTEARTPPNIPNATNSRLSALNKRGMIMTLDI